MRCPYCAEEVKDEALVCKHCQSELFVVKPLLQKISEMGGRLAALEKSEANAEAEVAALSHPHRASARRRGWELTALEAVALAYIAHVAAHFLLNVQFSPKLIFFKAASIAIPMIFGLLCRPPERRMLSTALLLGLIIAAMALFSELAVIAALDKGPFLPKNAPEWNEFALHSASIAFGFLTGVILRQLLMAFYLPNAKSNKSIEWIARFIVEQFGDGKPKFTLKAIRSMVSSILGVSSAIISIITGLWEYLK